MKRFLVIFTSHPSPPVDITVVAIDARCPFSAILAAKTEIEVPHMWTLARAVPWPRGCNTIDSAMKKVAQGR